MKILQVVDSLSDDSGGPTVATKNLAVALASDRHEVAVCGTKTGIKHAREVSAKGYMLYAFPAEIPRRYYYSPQLRNFLRKTIKKYDIVHIHGLWTYPALIASRICKIYDIPYIMQTCGMLDLWSMSQGPIKKRAYFHLVEKHNLKTASFVHFSTAIELKKCFYKKWNSSRIKCIPDMLNLEIFDKKNTALDRRLANKKYILFFGRLCYKKGLDILLEAFNRLQKDPKYKNIFLALMGPDSRRYFEVLRKKIPYPGMWDKIINIGMISGEKRFGIVKNTLFMCLPSRQENLGLSILETLACSVPVLVSRSVDIAHSIEEEYAGKTCTLNPAHLSSAMKEMIDSTQERIKMGQNGRRFVYREFERGALLQQYINMYEEARDRAKEKTRL